MADESRKCPVCESRSNDLLIQKQELRLVRCRECSMIYADPIPIEYSSGKFYSEAAETYYLTDAKLAGDFSPIRFRREIALFRKFCPKGRVLDIGCSTGGFLHRLDSSFPNQYTVAGADVAGPCLDHAEQLGIEVFRGDILEIEIQPGTFDAVTFWAVLEHLDRPADFLRKALQVLKPGGLAFVLVPNFDSLAVRILGAKYRYILPQHLNYFTRRTLLRLAGDQFRVLDSGSMHFNPLVIIQDLKGTKATDQARAELLRKTNAYKQNRALLPLRFGYNLVERALGWMHLADNSVLVLQKPAREEPRKNAKSTRTGI